MDNLRGKTLSNMFWKLFERVGAQLISFIVQIVLARLLEPGEFGIISMVTIFISIFNVFISSGLGTALIQKPNASSIDFSTVLIFNLVFSAALYAILFAGSPLIADFYGNDQLTPVLRILGIQIVFSGVKTVEQAYLAKNLQFKKFFKATIGGTILSGFVGVIMAYSGYGVWSLVAQHLTNSCIDCLILLFTVKWDLSFKFSFKRLKPLVSYGWKILTASLIDNIYNNLRSLVIGKKYSSADLAYFNKGQQFPELIYDNTSVTIESVIFPVMTLMQSDKARLKSATRNFIKTSSFIMSPLLVGLAVIAEPLASLLLTDKWLPIVPYIRIYCFVRILGPMQIANQQTIKAVGRSDITLTIEVIKKGIGIAILLVSMNYGVFYIALSNVLYSLIVLVVNAFPCKKLTGYSYFEQVKDLAPSLLLSSFMGAIVYLVSLFGLSNIVTLIIQVIVGVIVYFGTARLLKMESLFYVIDTLKPYIKGFCHRKERID